MRFNRWSSGLCYFSNIMAQKGEISQKLLRNRAKKAASIEDLMSGEKSPYFSPRKTRNQQTYKSEPKKIGKRAATSSKTVNKTETVNEGIPDEQQCDEPTSPKSSKWEPEHWKEVIENLRVMRLQTVAPVDTMGCQKCADEEVDAKTKRYHHLVALMLSSQTKDQITFSAMARLKEQGLTPQKVVEMNTQTLEELLKPVSFYKTKARNLQKTAQILIDQYSGDIPNNVEELVKLPGVGPKMAHLCMNIAWDIVSGIGVDVHVHRISNRLKWVKKPTKEPERTRCELESWLPSCYWSEVNQLLVGFGQTICTAQNPKCNECLNKNICPSAKITKEKSQRK